MLLDVAIAWREVGTPHPVFLLLEMFAGVGIKCVKRLLHASAIAGHQPERHPIKLFVRGVHGPEAQESFVGPQQGSCAGKLPSNGIA